MGQQESHKSIDVHVFPRPYARLSGCGTAAEKKYSVDKVNTPLPADEEE
jgi:hypothetical protein